MPMRYRAWGGSFMNATAYSIAVLDGKAQAPQIPVGGVFPPVAIWAMMAVVIFKGLV
ncbi:hypothetical protein GCM10007972_03400 [Iodidimonas muriae]|uniref:Uncharacterized protein n=1 Tax=Iodidimonas muriae TaxID=261467 RepID=A0ABQ2L7N7_9PROT|nr:hypothetical protein JCM17843_26660 [Kordiimonadales bacterium JCM 17843]GGO05731.1 hypothetical protein GCM10007972_03400 [Iodidimonas muriae]